MDEHSFTTKVRSIVDNAVDGDVSLHTIEDVLQAEAQNVREERRVYRVFVYECPEPNCEESTTQVVDQMELRCDVCEEGLELTESTLTDDSELMVFECGSHATTRVHEFSRDATACSIHHDPMQLMRSHTTVEGLGL
jgi:hypothetical protein